MYQFKYNRENETIELGDTGLTVAKKSRLGHFVPDTDPLIGKPVALYVFNGMNRVHENRFGDGNAIADRLTKGGFTQEKSQSHLSSGSYALTYNEYTDTIRVKDANYMVMNKGDDGKWQFDFDGGAPEQLLQKTYLLFHTNPDVREMSGPEALDVLSGGRKRSLEQESELSM